MYVDEWRAEEEKREKLRRTPSFYMNGPFKYLAAVLSKVHRLAASNV